MPRPSTAPAPLSVLDSPDSELVLGLVAAVGTDLGHFERLLSDHLGRFQYAAETIRLSRFLQEIELGSADLELRSNSEAERLAAYMDAGNQVRRLTRRADILALFAVSLINRERGDGQVPFRRRVHILRSLKHPDEVQTLRRIYGDGFYLIGVYSSARERRRYLQEEEGVPEKKAAELIRRDQEEEDPFGQKTRDTFHLADVFINLQDDFKEALWRFLDLLFGHPYLTPTADENAMFTAYSSSLRSASLSRQVGAVVTSAEGEVIAVGANDVPKFGGGLYWPGSADQRDHKWGFDSNDKRRSEIILDVMRRVRPEGGSDEDLLAEGRRLLKGSLVHDLTEFGRAVHAEMEALLSCARNGVSPRGGTLYSTTFPCHNCAKHIVAAGVTRVVYVEPYPKSMAEELHADALAVEQESPGKVLFQPFVGVSARRYFDLFSMNLSGGYRLRRKEDGKVVGWERAAANLRVTMPPSSYILREQLAIHEIAQAVAGSRRKGT